MCKHACLFFFPQFPAVNIEAKGLGHISTHKNNCSSKIKKNKKNKMDKTFEM